MSITGIGTTKSFTYHINAGKLESSNKGDDVFTQWYNGEISKEELPEEINGYDSDMKNQLEGVLDAYSEKNNSKGYKWLTENEGRDVWNVTVEIKDVDLIEIRVGGVWKTECHLPVLCAKEDESIFTGKNVPYATTLHQDYDATDNSIQIAVGDKFDVGSGYTLVVGKNSVDIIKQPWANPKEWDRIHYLSLALNDFLHFADQQWMSMESSDEINEVVIDFLKRLGVNTEEKFIVNKTRCEIVNGRIREVGNIWCIPSSMYNAAKRRYEELLYQPINKR